MWAVVVVSFVLVVYAAVLFNRLVGMRNLVKNGWADVDVYLKRRAELIPNLVETVKGYAAHESGTLEKLANARAAAMASLSVVERGAKEGAVTAEVHRALLLAEAYPELKASSNFGSLQGALSDTESKIAIARQYYNACVRDLNILVEGFPSNVVANLMGVRSEPFFEIVEMEDREVPTVSL